MADERNWREFVRTIPFWQYLVAGGSILGLVLLARYRIWPFGTAPPDPGNEPSVFEVLLNDRVIVGFLRAGIVAVVLYIIVSVPALVVARRWMKGLGTSGVTADDAVKADRAIEELQKELWATQDELQDQVAQTDLVTELLLESQQELRDNPSEEGEV